MVIDTSFDWEDDRLLDIPWNGTIIYELHVKGFTRRNLKIAPEKRGTFAGLGLPQAIEYLTDLGVTAVELLPVHQAVDDRILVDKGFTNYWGYNTICFFSPTAAFPVQATAAGRSGSSRRW